MGLVYLDLLKICLEKNRQHILSKWWFRDDELHGIESVQNHQPKQIQVFRYIPLDHPKTHMKKCRGFKP